MVGYGEERRAGRICFHTKRGTDTFVFGPSFRILPASVRLIRDVCTCLKSIPLRPGPHDGARQPYSPR